MVLVTKRKGETKDSLFRKFTRSFIEEDIINEVRNRLFYKKPSLVRQEKEKERIKMRHKRNRPTFFRRKI
jgi:ribosomal protein S21